MVLGMQHCSVSTVVEVIVSAGVAFSGNLVLRGSVWPGLASDGLELVILLASISLGLQASIVMLCFM